MATRAVLQVFEKFQKERVAFVSAVAEMAKNPQVSVHQHMHGTCWLCAAQIRMHGAFSRNLYLACIEYRNAFAPRPASGACPGAAVHVRSLRFAEKQAVGILAGKEQRKFVDRAGSAKAIRGIVVAYAPLGSEQRQRWGIPFLDGRVSAAEQRSCLSLHEQLNV